MHPGVKHISSHFCPFEIIWTFDSEPLNASAVDGSISLTVSVLVRMQMRLQVRKKMHNSDKLMDTKRHTQAVIKLKLLGNTFHKKQQWAL